MSEPQGHFEQGRWVEDPEPATDAPAIGERIQETSQSVRKAIDDVFGLGRHLFGTAEGQEHIERTARAAGADLSRAVNDVAESARRALKRR